MFYKYLHPHITRKSYKAGYRFSLLILLLFSSLVGSSQVFWTEDFQGSMCLPGSGCDATLVGWTIANTGGNGGAANQWYVSIAEEGIAAGGCGSGGTGIDQSLHLGNVSTSTSAGFWCPTGDCGAAYDASSALEITNKRVESPTIDCSAYGTITLSFNYIEGGQGTQDDCTVWYFDGTTWAQIANPAKTATCAPGGQGLWTSFSTLLPASADGNANVRIGFNWTNDGDGLGNDPSFGVDDISLNAAVTLDVDLLSFDATCRDQSVDLNWLTGSEQDVDQFIIRGSPDGLNWKMVGSVPGSNTSGSSSYDYTVTNYERLRYFQLVEKTYDGAEQVLATTAISEDCLMNTSKPTVVYTPEGLVISDVENINGSLEIFDISGRLVYSTPIKTIDSQLIRIKEVTLRQNAHYIVRIEGGNVEYSQVISVW